MVWLLRGHWRGAGGASAPASHPAPRPAGRFVQVQHHAFRFSADNCGSPDLDPVKARLFMKPHLRLLGVLQLTWGAIGLLLGAAMLFLSMGALAIGMSGTGDRVGAGVTALTFG